MSLHDTPDFAFLGYTLVLGGTKHRRSHLAFQLSLSSITISVLACIMHRMHCIFLELHCRYCHGLTRYLLDRLGHGRT